MRDPDGQEDSAPPDEKHPACMDAGRVLFPAPPAAILDTAAGE